MAALSTRADDTVERAAVACLRMDLYTTLDQSDRAVAVGLDYLRHLGIDWSPHPTEEEARREYERIWSQLGEPRDRGADRPAVDERPGIARDAGCSDQARAAGIIYGREPACPGHLPSGQSQPRARQQRRFVLRLRACLAWSPARASATTRRDFASASSAMTWSNSADLKRFQARTYHELRQSRPALDETCPDWPRSAAPRVRGGEQRSATSLMRPTAATT